MKDPAEGPRGDDAGGVKDVETRESSASTRYPGYDVLAKWNGPDWDEQTRAVVRRRIADVPTPTFLTPDELRLLEALVDRIVPQPDRPEEALVPIVPWIDEKLALDARDGYRYEELPPLRETWRLGLAGIEESARMLHGASFADLADAAQDDVLARVQAGDVAAESWRRVPSTRFFRDVLCLTVVRIYYAHPAAWSEIGYSGPSSPRGHVRNWMGGVDPWDAPDADPA